MAKAERGEANDAAERTGGHDEAEPDTAEHDADDGGAADHGDAADAEQPAAEQAGEGQPDAGRRLAGRPVQGARSNFSCLSRSRVDEKMKRGFDLHISDLNNPLRRPDRWT